MSSDAETVEFTIKVTGDEAGGPFVAAIRADKKDFDFIYWMVAAEYLLNRAAERLPVMRAVWGCWRREPGRTERSSQVSARPS